MDKAVELYEEAISIFCDMGRFPNAAKLEKEIAEMYESDNQADKAVQHYRQAANYYQSEDSVNMVNQCLLKVAHFEALNEKYDEAISIFEKVAQACLEKNILKFNAKGHLFCAGILHLCQNVDLIASFHLGYCGDAPGAGEIQGDGLYVRVQSRVQAVGGPHQRSGSDEC